MLAETVPKGTKGRKRRQKSKTIVDPSEMMSVRRSNHRKRKHHQSKSWGKTRDLGAHSHSDRDPEDDDDDDRIEGRGHFMEIATPHRKWIFCAETESARNAWYSQIRDNFSDKLMLKIYFDSPCNVNVLHNGQSLKDRYVALLKGWLILFRDKRTLNAIRRMTFFSDTIFRDYVRTQNCQTIPLRNAEIVRNFKSIYGQWSFEVSIGDRCWYFGVDTLEILSQWLHLLTRRDDADFSHFEQSYSNAPLSGTEEHYYGAGGGGGGYIQSPVDRMKKIGADYNLNGLQEAIEPALDDDAISDITDMDVELPVDDDENGKEKEEVHSNPIAIPMKHSRSRSKNKGNLQVGDMDQAPYTFMQPVVTLPKLSWNSNSANSTNHGDGDSLQYSCNLHTSLEEIETPIQSMDEWNSSFTREIRL